APCALVVARFEMETPLIGTESLDDFARLTKGAITLSKSYTRIMVPATLLLKTRESASLSRGGWIISIEGVDAVGKSTQSLRLQTWFKRKGFKVTSLSFPDYETPIGKEIKAFLAGKRDFQAEVRHMLFAANR